MKKIIGELVQLILLLLGIALVLDALFGEWIVKGAPLAFR